MGGTPISCAQPIGCQITGYILISGFFEVSQDFNLFTVSNIFVGRISCIYVGDSTGFGGARFRGLAKNNLYITMKIGQLRSWQGWISDQFT